MPVLLCERCYGPIDPERERFYRLAHVDHAEPSGRLVWNHAAVHTEPCVPAGAPAHLSNADRNAA